MVAVGEGTVRVGVRSSTSRSWTRSWNRCSGSRTRGVEVVVVVAALVAVPGITVVVVQ